MGVWSTPPLPAALGGGDPSAFVGRLRELEAMERVWSAVVAGSRQAVFIGGEPGVGKSRLVAELAQTLHREGASVLWGASYADLDVPYRPFVTALDGLLAGADAAALGTHLPAEPDQLLRLTPRFGDLVPGAVRVPDAITGEAALPLFEAVAGFLADLATRAPVVVVLEDLHWGGRPTVQMLKHLVRSRVGVPLLILVTHRTTAPDRSSELTYAIADLYPLGGVTRLDLAGLDVEDIADYLVGESGKPRAELLGHATVLRDQTAGNPFFLRELWRDLREHDGLDTLRASVRTPATVRDTLDRRLDALQRSDRDIIELAAVAGQRVASTDLVAASPYEGAATLRSLDVAVAAGILAMDPAHEGTYVFRHALVRHAVLDGLAPSVRAELNARLAESLAARGTETAEVVARLAHHYEAAQALGYTSQAVEHLRRVGQHAERSLAHGDAADVYERAGRLCTGTALREELLLAACRCRRTAGAFDRARALAEELAASPDAEVAVRAALEHEEASWRPGFDGRRSLDLLEESLARYRGRDEDPLRVRGSASTARALSFVGQSVRARVLGERAVALARASADEELLSHALACTLWRGMAPTIATELLTRADELSGLARRRGDAERLGPAGFYRAVFSYMLGDRDGWEAGTTDVEAAAGRTGEPFMRYVLDCSTYARAYACGDYGVARTALEHLAGFTDEFGTGSTEGSHGIQSYLLERVTGGLERVRPLVSGDEDVTTHWAPGLLSLHVELGHRVGVERVLPHVLDLLDGPDVVSVQRAQVLAFAVEAAALLGSRPAAEQLLPHLSPYRGMNLISGQFVGLFGAADRYLGTLESLLGVGEPEASFEAALAMDRSMRAVTHQIETLHAWADHLRTRGDATAERRLQQLESEAAGLASHVGYRRARPTPRGAPDQRPDELTLRELDVLRLVARGLSNREIGGELFISQNTAANHVRSILMKTGAPNRTSAAMYAAEHGLLEDA